LEGLRRRIWLIVLLVQYTVLSPKVMWITVDSVEGEKDAGKFRKERTVNWLSGSPH
jgi:hypothetical protein